MLSSLLPIPSSPFLLPYPPLIVLHLLSHITVLFLAYLLFTPSKSSSHRLLRGLLVLPTVWFCIFNSFLWRLPSPLDQEKQKGLVITGTVWGMRAVEMGFRKERPLWLGWEEGESDEATERRRRDRNDVSTRGKRLRLAMSYCYSYRNIGWDSSASKSKFRNRPQTRAKLSTSRLDFLLSSQLPRLARTYLLMDFTLGFWALHPYFSRCSTATQGSIYTPLRLVPFLPSFVAPWWISSSTLALLLGFNLYISQAFTNSLISTVWTVVCSDWQEFEIHDVEMYERPWKSDSLRELWSFRWHKLYRSQMLLSSYTPGSYLFGQFGGVIATFVLSGAFHAVGYYDPFSSSPEITILHAKRFV
ncbi:hypothetical protein BDY24DRAFT_371211 [Mrakia frigida]|uniref:uncharacterized protein n=1 Tax=Mrakia frigida TaxID=29902 RepID=UPI003FCC0D15